MEDDFYPEDYYDDDEYYENQPSNECPRCGRSYDDIDFDYQSCSKCGWDNEKGCYENEIVREPEDEDYLNGDADLLTGQWN
jgi:predicted  nucleic acid-binding Zn-ribbon protein